MRRLLIAILAALLAAGVSPATAQNVPLDHLPASRIAQRMKHAVDVDCLSVH